MEKLKIKIPKAQTAKNELINIIVEFKKSL